MSPIRLKTTIGIPPSDQKKSQQKRLFTLHTKFINEIAELRNLLCAGKPGFIELNTTDTVRRQANENDISKNSVDRIIGVLELCADEAQCDSHFRRALDSKILDYAGELSKALFFSKEESTSSNNILDQLMERSSINEVKPDNHDHLTKKNEHHHKLNDEQYMVFQKMLDENADGPQDNAKTLIASLEKARLKGKGNRNEIMDIAAKMYSLGVSASLENKNEIAKTINNIFKPSYLELLYPGAKEFLTESLLHEEAGEDLLNPNRAPNYAEVLSYLKNNLRNIRCETADIASAYGNRTNSDKNFNEATKSLIEKAKALDIGKTICTPFHMDGNHWTLMLFTKERDGSISCAFIDSNATEPPEKLKSRLNQALLYAQNETKTLITLEFSCSKLQKAVQYYKNGGTGSDNHCGAWCCAAAKHIDRWVDANNGHIKNGIQDFSASAKNTDISIMRGQMIANLLVPGSA
jgi:hypothetical protein